MRAAYFKGENSMEWCRKFLSQNTGVSENNELLAILVAYDLQAGSYVDSVRKNRKKNFRWCQQLGGIISKSLKGGDSILEIGVGEATTLVGVLKQTRGQVASALGFDISWSRLAVGKKWLVKNRAKAELFAGDLMSIPLADNSVDVIYSSHSLEPNRGREEVAISECLRVARRTVVLVEPIYELAHREAQARMRQHGYVIGLKETAARLGAEIQDYRLLEYSPNPHNPSGVIILRKNTRPEKKIKSEKIKYCCPISREILEKHKNYFFAPKIGLAYPMLQTIPMLRPDHAIVASKINSNF